jgi:hypothetical protein
MTPRGQTRQLESMTETQVAAPAAPEAQDLSESALLQMAADFDSGKLGSEHEAGALAPAGEQAKPQDNGAEAKPSAEPTAESKTDSKPEAAPAKPDKAQREAERRERSWKALEEQKAAFRAEQERLAKEKAEIEELRRQAKPSSSEADNYERIAREYEEKGEDDYARIARQKAREIRESESRVQQEQSQRKAQDEWNRDFAELRDKDPDVADEGSETHKAMVALLKQEQWLYQVPGGLKKAHTFVKQHQEAAAASGLRSKVEEQSKRISELEQKLSLGGSFPTAPQGEKTFEQMNSKEQEQYLRHLARQADGEV